MLGWKAGLNAVRLRVDAKLVDGEQADRASTRLD